MQLFASATSPFVRKVLVLIAEGGIGNDVQIIPVSGTPLDAGTLPTAHNPLGKIPALVLENGSTIYDSRVICRYLDDRYDLGFYPKGAGIWPFLTHEALVDGILDAAVLMAYEMRLRPEEIRFDAWVQAQWEKVVRGLDVFEASPLHGPLSMLHISLGCALGYADFRHDARSWRTGRAKLAAWYGDFSQRPSLLATKPV